MTVPSGSAFPSLLDPEVGQDPHAHYARLREHAPVYRDPRMGAYLVTTYDAVWEAYRDTRFSTRGYQATLETIHGRTVLSLEGSLHAKNRALLTPHFRGKALDALDDRIHQAAAQLVSEIAPRSAATLTGELIEQGSAGGAVDIAAQFSQRFPISVIAEMLGLPQADRPQFIDWYTRLMAFVTNYAADPDVNARGVRAKQELTDYLLPLIAERRKKPGSDLVSAIVESEVDGYRMTDDEVRAYASLLLTAGGDTTDKAFSSLIRNLLLYGEWERVRDDRSLVTPAIAETLRFSPPSQMTTRLTEEDVELAGAVIPAESIVYLVGASANRDPAKYERPDEFRVGREDLLHTRAFSGAADHVGFGAGRHFCIGAMLARTEMDVALNQFLDAFPSLRLADGETGADVGLRTRGPATVLVETGT
ncbi:cytochrome P450 [Blastococcus sp. CT_GayMR20]|uniref:cytochrome P450 n=1 Tax=Blastococcus sp. CT_GayMR20 TaxID=2559609 RepID=UPI00107312B4|nr:cytochrome P450 [Blastococcus sp. CT_GayMR20]TFV93791.1 cytochrome P450 [Blastococcus sp. CT_GayMR20]TFV93804.1 cytochrome P450 [Blastococcus sp. CT_GayMR20]